MRPKAVSTDQLRQIWQNRQCRRDPVAVGSSVRALLKAERLDGPSPLMDLRRVWASAVGPELSRHSRPEALRRGTLRVVVDSAAHLAELQSLVRAGLAKQVAVDFDQRPIKIIRLRLGCPNGSGRQAKGTD
ncbi:MAG: DUF721 domain-containing protein [Actinobacteria bacterium]|nr:DUF721 domain-containing protein [Actinomycetota bacterium]